MLNKYEIASYFYTITSRVSFKLIKQIRVDDTGTEARNCYEKGYFMASLGIDIGWRRCVMLKCHVTTVHKNYR